MWSSSTIDTIQKEWQRQVVICVHVFEYFERVKLNNEVQTCDITLLLL